MSYCLKTGGLILDEAHDCVWECDLHVEGNCIIAYLAGKPSFGFELLTPRIGLVVSRDANPFYREGQPYSVLVVEQKYCRLRACLREHIDRWYPGYVFQFAGDEA